MKPFRFIELVVGCCLFFICSTVSAQWPFPANTPGTEVPCPNCTGSFANKLTPAYQEPISAFAGRFLDSVGVRDFQGGFRTARGYQVAYSPQKDRLYFRLGSAAGAYSRSSFFNRLANREPLTSAMVSEVAGSNLESRHSAGPEAFLRWDQWFYAEFPGSGWHTIIQDGQDRLPCLAIDDRGFVYLATGTFGWGIVKDNGTNDSTMMQGPQFFETGTPNEITGPGAVLPVKTSNGHYYALVSGGQNYENVWDVTDINHVTRGLVDVTTTYTAAISAPDRTAFVNNGRLLIYNNDTLINNGAPLQALDPPAGFHYAFVDTDGTNFYAAIAGGVSFQLIKLSPNGNKTSYSGTPVPINVTSETGASVAANVLSIHYGDGYVSAVVNNFTVGHDVMLFRVDSSGFTEIPLRHFINDYYMNINGYKPDVSNNVAVSAGFGLPYDAMPMRYNNKLYLIVCTYGIGDVYQIRSDDDVSVAVQGTSGTINPNAPARPAGTLYYGDRVRFLGSTSSTSPKNIQWNFGNPEAAAGADPNTFSNSTGQTVDHQYSGITPGTLGTAPRTVTVTNTSGNGAGTASVLLSVPTARLGVTNATTSFTFITSAASASRAPIVAGDSFFDASDGEIEGHYSEWSLDSGAAVAKVPYASGGSHLVSVGACGAHTLDFAAHYGPYTNFVTAGGADFRVPLSGLSYNVQPVAAAIAPFTTDALGNLVFSSISRVTADTSVLSASQASTLTWRWDLVDTAENVTVQGPTGTGPISSITPWTLAKTNFTAVGLRVRLTIASSALTGACAGKETSKAFTQALNGPDPVISGGCTNGGPPCTFTVTSGSGINMTSDNWHFSWSATGTTVNAGEDKPTWTPAFVSPGQFTVSVTVNNAVGTKTVGAGAAVTTVGTLCPTMNANNVYPVFQNSNFTCSLSHPVCSLGESVLFSVQANGYDFGCSNHTYEWDFGDNQKSTQATPSHVYSSNGNFTVTLVVKNATQTYSATTGITIGGIVTPPPPPPPPPPPGGGGCPTMTATNMFPTYLGSTGNCNSSNQQTCTTGETVRFNAQANGYDPGCATHSYSWNFGDNTTGSGSNPTHVYAAGGNYTVTMTVVNSTQTYISTVPLKVTGTSGPCQPMTANNLYPVYQNPSFTCTAANNSGCQPGQVLTFVPQGSGYDLGCSTHTFDWDFGDSSAHSTAQSPTHIYNAIGTYTITLKVHNSQQDHQVTTTINVTGDPVKPAPKVDFTATTPDSSKPLLVVFTPTVDPANTAVTKVTWDFGDNSSITKSTLQQVTNLYAKAGTYQVTVTVESSGAQPGIKTLPITLVVPSRTRAVRH